MSISESTFVEPTVNRVGRIAFAILSAVFVGFGTLFLLWLPNVLSDTVYVIVMFSLSAAVIITSYIARSPKRLRASNQ